MQLNSKIIYSFISLFYKKMAATFVNKEGKEISRTPCEVYTRVMGYIRPVSNYNQGKKSEFYGRKYFEENLVDNSEFLRKFGNTSCPCGM